MCSTADKARLTGRGEKVVMAMGKKERECGCVEGWK